MLCNVTSQIILPANQMGNFATTTKLTFWSAFLPVRLHSDMRIQVIECTISFLTTLVPTFIHAFDFFIAPAGTLVLLCTRNRNERVDLRKRVRILCAE